MKIALFQFGIWGLNLIYGIMKLLIPQQNQIVFLSRQYDTPSKDALLTADKIKEIHSDYTICFRFCMLKPGLKSKIQYVIHLLGDMVCLARSRVAICDTYSIPISVLKQRKNLKVIQIWHAMGAIKKFGWQSLGKEDGRSEKISRVMKMHANYSYVLAPSVKTGEFYQEAFHVQENQIVIGTLPHMDEILLPGSRKTEFERNYPAFEKKKLAVYVPTFRDGEAEFANDLQKAFREEKSQGRLLDWELLISPHPLSKMENAQDYRFPGFDSMDLIKMSDCVITDYSACAFEAACLNKKLLFYVPDMQEYRVKRGLNIDPLDELSEITSVDSGMICRMVTGTRYPWQLLHDFAHLYIENTEHCSTQLAAFVIKLMEEAQME